MHNPANDNCPMNADPRNGSCACIQPGKGSIVLTPAYEHIFATMLHEAAIRSEALTLFDFLGIKQQAQALRAVQGFLAPLNVAAQCMTNREAVEQFREAINRIVQDIDRTAGIREEMAEED